MHNVIELTINKLEPHIMGLLRGSIPNIATALLHDNVAVIKIPIKIERVGGELRTTAGIKIQLCSEPPLYIATPEAEVGGGTRMDHL